MIWSGLLIYWANDVYRVGVGSWTAFHFFPDGFYKTLHSGQRLAEGMSWHFAMMWIFMLNGLAYVGFLALSGQWRHVVPSRESWIGAIQVVLHDLHLRKTAPPQGKYNGAQQIAYTAVILMGGGSLLTGLAIYKPVQFAWLGSLFGGYEGARFWHFWLMIGFCGFFLIHVAQVVRAGWGNFQSMITGREIKDDQVAANSETKP